MITGYVPGGFDMLHVGHLNILTEAAKRCDHLIAGVATDESLERMKGRGPIVPLAHRAPGRAHGHGGRPAHGGLRGPRL